ncbi:MAG: hypothetical protein ACJAYR_002690 [Sneathiella sp.]|jgi:hypothetical protein
MIAMHFCALSSSRRFEKLSAVKIVSGELYAGYAVYGPVAK